MSNHTNETDLLKQLDKCREIVLVGRLYYHYRTPTDFYKVLDIGLDEATENVVVIYQAQYGKYLIWVRSFDKWCESVENNGKMVQRFELANI